MLSPDGEMSPLSSPYGANPDQLVRLNLAKERFAAAGLTLPDLQVEFTDVRADCDGHHGQFNRHVSPPRITYCANPPDWVYEHELAHA